MLLKDKGRAFFIHLVVSAFFLVLVYLFVRFVWFPAPFFELGGGQGFYIVLIVDLVLGPTLTFVIYNKNQKRLLVDLSIVGAVQVSALMWGLSQVNTQRPCVQVLAHDGLHVFTREDFSEYSGSSCRSSTITVMDLPLSLSDVETVAFVSEFIEGKPFALRQDMYLGWSEAGAELKEFYTSLYEVDSGAACAKARLYFRGLNSSVCISFEDKEIIY